MNEPVELKALRRGMALMPRFRVLPNQEKLWNDLLVTSAIGEWVMYEDVKRHYDIVMAIVLRCRKRADDAEQRAERLVESYAKIKREYDEYVSLCEEQSATIRQLRAKEPS